jgi:hypothetical protein
MSEIANAAKITCRKTRDSDAFDASENSMTKRQKQYVNWRTTIQRTFTIDTMHFNNEFQRIQHIVGLLKKDVYRFFEASFTIYNEHPKNPNFWP